MNSEYDNITAFHYLSYRPSLHYNILKLCLSNESFNYGLDIGCGTGHSTIALINFCVKLVGIDPSSDMIAKAIPHEKANYELFDKRAIAYEDDLFDVVTLAGSLWYAKSQILLDEIIRVGKNKTVIVVYDFEVLVADILNQLGFVENEDLDDVYDHMVDFSGLNLQKVEQITSGSEKIRFQVSPKNLAHLLLSVKPHYVFFNEEYGVKELHVKLEDRLTKLAENDMFHIDANTFFTTYSVNKA